MREPAVFQEIFDLIEKLVGDMQARWNASALEPLPFGILRNVLSIAKRSLKDLLGRALVLSGAQHRYFRGRALIVAFHSVTVKPSKEALRCGVRDFDAYCRFFARHLPVCTMTELVERVQRGETLDGQLAIPFDDGYADNAELAAPILARYRLPATFFVATAFIGSETQTPWDLKAGVRSRWMTRQQVQALHAAGYEIGAHTQTHCDLGEVPEAFAAAEIAGARADILAWIGHAPRHFAIPYGRAFPTLPRISTIARELGFDTVTLCRGGLLDPTSQGVAWERIPISPGDYLSPYGWFFDVFRGVNLRLTKS